MALTVAVTMVEFPLVWLVNNDGEYVMGMLSETSSLFDDEDWWWTEELRFEVCLMGGE